MPISYVLPEQFEDVVYSPVLLSNHGAGTGRGACLQLLDDTASSDTPTSGQDVDQPRLRMPQAGERLVPHVP